MAQTIAVQRGSTTVTQDGGSKTTIFTQSSGIATRVILTSVSCNFAGSSGNSIFMLAININGTGNYVPVAMRKHSNYSSRYLVMFPSDSATGTSFTSNITAASSSGMSLAATNDGGFITNLNNWIGGGYNSNLNGALPLNIVPSNFWMANGDSLIVMAYNDLGSFSATINYHFTTVTES